MTITSLRNMLAEMRQEFRAKRIMKRVCNTFHVAAGEITRQTRNNNLVKCARLQFIRDCDEKGLPKKMVADLLNIGVSHYRDLLKEAKIRENWYAYYRYTYTGTTRGIYDHEA